MDTENVLTLTTADRTILRHLYGHPDSPTSLYELHVAHSFSPAQLGNFVAKLSGAEIIDFEGEKILITDFGKKWLLANRIAIFFQHVKYDFQEIPSEMLKNKIAINSLYSPQKEELGKNYFNDMFRENKE